MHVLRTAKWRYEIHCSVTSRARRLTMLRLHKQRNNQHIVHDTALDVTLFHHCFGHHKTLGEKDVQISLTVHRGVIDIYKT